MAPAIALRPQGRLPPAWGRSHGAAVGRGGVLARVRGRGQRGGATRWRRAQGGAGPGDSGESKSTEKVQIKITPRAFGKDWRLPIVNKFQE